MIQRLLARKTVFRQEWSLGLYRGATPFTITEIPSNPILTTRDMGSLPNRFIADPFLFYWDEQLYLFFEVLNLITRKGEIAVAVPGKDGRWQSLGVVLAADFHLSFPQVFSDGGQIYMLPESHKVREVRLWRATAFPRLWEPDRVLLAGKPYSDSVILYAHHRWWLFVTEDNQHLRLFSSSALHGGNWEEHPQSPVYTGLYARPAGKILVFQDRLFRFAQNPQPNYGTSIMAFEITQLTESAYEEEMLPKQPFLGPGGQGWNAMRMHHVDFLQTADSEWLAVADGYSHALDTRWGVYPYKIRDRYLQGRGR